MSAGNGPAEACRAGDIYWYDWLCFYRFGYVVLFFAFCFVLFGRRVSVKEVIMLVNTSAG